MAHNNELPPTREARRAPGLAHRLILLFACLGGGALIGYVGLRLTGSTAWFLAVPACVVAGWFTVANPTECLPTEQRKPSAMPLDPD